MQYVDTNATLGHGITKVLELAHGPGHLQVTLHQAGYNPIGIDLSPQMSMLAHHRLDHVRLPSTLARASVYALPFADKQFSTVISTFPTEFIYSPQVLREAQRVLVEGGKLVVIPAAPLRLNSPAAYVLQVAYRITRQTGTPGASVRHLFDQAGFDFYEEHVTTQRAEVIVWVGVRRSASAPAPHEIRHPSQTDTHGTIIET